MNSYASLHCHTEYSLLDGMARVEDLAKQAKKLGIPAIGFSDHGNLNGAYQQWKACNEVGVKPIIGCEFYFAPEGAEVREAVVWGETDEGKNAPGRYTHMCLFALNAEGLRNLFRLQAMAYEKGFYYKPRIDMEMLREVNAGIVATTGCMGGVLATRVRLGQINEARQHLSDLYDIFGDRLYAEVMDHGVPGEERMNDTIITLAQRQGIPLLHTLDCHYVEAGQAEAHDCFLCIQTGATLQSESRFSFSGSGYHLRSYDEMVARNLPIEALENTLKLADRVESYDEVFTGPPVMPKYDTDDEAETLTEQAFEGMALRLGDDEWFHDEKRKVYLDRLEYELGVINQMGYPGYFLCLAHIIREGRARGIIMGPGRGSAPGSLVAYALHITHIDPIIHNLMFERFLNPQRKSLPDIDLDIATSQRQEMLDIARELYGEEEVVSIGTFGTIGAKAALKDSARVLGYSFQDGAEYTRLLPKAKHGREPGLDEYTGPKDEVYKVAVQIEGFIRNQSQHPGGIIISPDNLRDKFPLWKQGGKGPWICGFDMHEVEACGYQKFDFLGVGNLDVIATALRTINDQAE